MFPCLALAASSAFLAYVAYGAPWQFVVAAFSLYLGVTLLACAAVLLLRLARGQKISLAPK